ncbi:MAG: MerR family DNA-binding transcriptional regulator [Defluviitaleaceae bacterium]|nr:MerR family DNA-binding transcriptional regulator [Defluviitaleaceae bacterium]
MSRKNKLLSIGEISKLTGASIKSLRYYERINILKPAYVDPNSGYRYYSFKQAYLVGLITFYIELDIPLRELPEFLNGQDSVNLDAFLAHGKKAAQKKIKTLEKGLKLINFFEKKMASQEKYTLEQLYTQELPEKYFYVIPYDQTFDNADQYEIVKLFRNIPFYEAYEEAYATEQPEYGFLYECSPSGIRRYNFAEVPQNGVWPDYKTIPAGKYHCRQSEDLQIEQSREIFKDYLNGRDSFIAIETDAFHSKLNISNPVGELRVIAL